MKQVFLFFIALSIVSITHTTEYTGPSASVQQAANVDLTNWQLMIYFKSGFDFLLYHLTQQEGRQNNHSRQIIANQNKFCQSINANLAALSSRVDYLVESSERRDATIRRLEEEVATIERDIARIKNNIALLNAREQVQRRQEQTQSLWGTQAITTTTRSSLHRNTQGHQLMDTDRTSSFM